ncbi:MAG: hypothetical protein CMQ30_00925 [Gammaproteobacteria bacterium]|nr:hypothetical protein [Gammaproteobacteria bacterium]
MRFFEYHNSQFDISDELRTVYINYWRKLAKPGSWWSGVERIAIAEASRGALKCLFCLKRKKSLSPYSIEGEHDSVDGLSQIAIDAVHRVVTDQTRITQKLISENEKNGLSQEAYVELVGIVVAVFSIDEFHRALDIPLEMLPDPIEGEASGYKPSKIGDDIGFVSTILPDGAFGNENDLWPEGFGANVVRALSLVPDAVRDWKELAAAQYIPLERMRDYYQDKSRALNRLQMELVAGRVSAVNECFY